MRLRRKPATAEADFGTSVTGKISEDFFMDLLWNVGFCRDPPISPEGYRRAYLASKDRLMRLCRPFTRPAAYWSVEVGGALSVGPDCPANGNESERSALIRLGLPLTNIELGQLSPAELMQWQRVRDKSEACAM
jgi:hypothetical protein